MLNRSRIRIPRQALRHGQLADLPQLEIPDAVSVPFGDPASSLFAIGISAINNGLNVFVPPYPGMYPGDYIEVFWDNSGVPVAGQPVTQNNVNQTIGLTVPYGSFANGRFTPYYRITRSSTVQVYSVTRDIWVKLTRPGNFDPNPATPEQEALLAPILPDDVRDGLDDLRARLGVDVTIEPYPFMAEYDRIDFSWGGARRVYTVQPDEVGQPIVVHITEADILAAGDGQVLLMYTVIDAAFNRTADAKWSMTARVDVDTRAHLDEPYVEEADLNNVLDLDALGDADATATVYVTRGGDFAIGDTLVLTWAGFDSHGAALTPYVPPSQTITRLPGPVSFVIPHAIVAASAQGRAILSYVLHKQNGDTLNSRRTTVRIVGEVAPDLPLPIVTQNQGGTLPADIARANVTVLAYSGMGVGDEITLIWDGQRASGEPTTYRSTFNVTEAWVGRDLPFTVDGPTRIAILAGGQVTLYYQIDYADGTALVRESARLTLNVDTAAGQLPRPVVIEAPTGIFDPALALATVQVPGAPLVANDRVTITWRGDVTGLHTDSGIVRTTGQPMNFMVTADDIAGNRQITVTYSINGGPASSVLTLLAAEADDLPIPEVEQANNGVLRLIDVPATGAIAHVRPYDRIALNDHVTLYLEQPAGDVRWELRETVTNTTQDVLYTIPRSVLVGLLNHTVQLRYMVEFVDGSTNHSTIANLSIEEGVSADRPIIEVIRNPRNEDIPNGGNTNYIRLTLSGTAARDERIELFDGDISLGIVDVRSTGDWSLQVMELGSGEHTFTAEGLYDDFPVSEPYGLRITFAGYLFVMGGRSANRSQFRKGVTGAMIPFRRLHALDTAARRPMPARWRYEHEAAGTGVTTNDFRDTQPDAMLYVSTDNDLVILRPRNIAGNGGIGGNGGAFTALRDQGNLVAWGEINAGALPSVTDVVEVMAGDFAFAGRRANKSVIAWGGSVVPAHIAGMTDIVEVIGNGYAFAARREDNSVVAWGSAGSGGSFPEGSLIPGLNDIVDVVSNFTAFAARRANGSVVAWGNTSYDSGNGPGALPSAIASLTDIVEVTPTYYAFAARRENGKVVTWGGRKEGGSMPSDIANLEDIVEVIGSYGAFAARRANGSVVAWGEVNDGGSVPANIRSLTDIVEVIPAGGGFTARCANGSVVAWGNVDYGGTVPADILRLTDIVEVVGSSGAFAARCANGQVVAWGHPNYGGVVPGHIAPLTDIVDVVAAQFSFAALRSNGGVVAWGADVFGGQIPASVVPLLTDVRAIYANGSAYAALTGDRRVITWGYGRAGGSNTSVPSTLQGNISYELKAAITQTDDLYTGSAKPPSKRGKRQHA